MVLVREVRQVEIKEGNTKKRIRSFALSTEDRKVTVVLSNLGASITHFYIPSSDNGYDDIVLGYRSITDMYETKNPTYLGVVVGRVANRIAKGRLRLNGTTTQLEINNPPNHLHGGSDGFSTRIWEAEMKDDGVTFTLESPHGDQSYPGAVRVSAHYRLYTEEQNNCGSVKLRVEMSAVLLTDEPTPINLAQHSYFNLASHSHSDGILRHELQLLCEAYTPLDETSIPTREVRSLDEAGVMDFRQPRLIESALQALASESMRMREEDFACLLKGISNHGKDEKASKAFHFPSSPFGFDHNYCRSLKDSNRSLGTVAVLSHKGKKRKLIVRSDAPGVQVYTANYLDGATTSTGNYFKDGARYKPWQAVCLETQHYPDSIDVDDTLHPSFATGRCPILSRDNPNYSQELEYTVEWDDEKSRVDPSKFFGSDTDENTYSSVEEMWQSQNIESDKESWYDRASDYYEDNCETSVDGVLGGFANLSDTDLINSREFVDHIEHLRPISWSDGAACECGAGIGRVSKGLLLGLNPKRCDLVESSARLLYAAPEYIGQESSKCRYFCQGLQEWEPHPETYSIIWIQWVLCYLTDDDTIEFLKRCARGLIKGGIIVLKENTCKDQDFVVDLEDASVTRSLRYWIWLVEKAGLSVVIRRSQTQFPDDMFPVEQLALEIKE